MQIYSSKDNLKIVLGGGPKKTEGWLNLDILPSPEVDIVCDLNQGIPLPDNSVTAVSARHLLEHLDDTAKIMEEIWRVAKPEAVVSIKVPYYASMGAYQDPTHRRFFTEKTFQYFTPPMQCAAPCPTIISVLNLRLSTLDIFGRRAGYATCRSNLSSENIS